MNEAAWVAGEIDTARLARVRETGEMRNVHDWALQPGAPSSKVAVETVDLP